MWRVSESIYIDQTLSLTEDLSASSTNRFDFLIDKWVREMPVRKAINNRIMQEIVQLSPSSIVEIGGGLSEFSIELATRYNYINIDLLAHVGHGESEYLERESPNWLWISDWRSVRFPSSDLGLAIDIFPNVDQGIVEFLDKASNIERLILTCTFYEQKKSYVTKRLDAEEVLTVVPWRLQTFKHEMKNLILNVNTIVKPPGSKSPFLNERDVFFITLEKL